MMAKFYVVLFLVFGIGGTSFVFAGEPHGSLSIQVVGPGDTPVVGASVKAVRIRDSALTEAHTADQGKCKMDLPIGTYGLTVRALGFKADFTGGVNVRAETDFPLRFSLFPGDPNEKLPQEKTPAEHAADLARAQAAAGRESSSTPAAVVNAAYEGLDESCKACQIKRTNGGPAARATQVRAALELVQQQKYSEALEKYKLALGEDAADPTSWFNCGVLFGVEQQSKPSETCFRTAIGLCGGGGEPDYHAYLGRVLGKQGRLKEAESSFRAAMLLSPERSGQYTYELGCAYHSQRNFEQASVLFAKALELKCPDPQVDFAYGNALEMLGKKKEALEHYRVFLEKGTTDPTLADLLQRTQEKVKRLSGTEGGK